MAALLIIGACGMREQGFKGEATHMGNLCFDACKNLNKQFNIIPGMIVLKL